MNSFELNGINYINLTKRKTKTKQKECDNAHSI